jgi:hypothetical protein
MAVFIPSWPYSASIGENDVFPALQIKQPVNFRPTVFPKKETVKGYYKPNPSPDGK